ncbi:MAG: TIGR03915 family putative DNA repair protein [Clostridia bacterium]|nr:TIGR03915 family putative DNA repair protein [Clostridia bacterium]
MIFYICDGTPENFFTAVFDAYNTSECMITSDKELQLSLGCATVSVQTDLKKCERVRRGLKKYDKHAEEDILAALRSFNTNKEQICFLYIKRLLAHKKPIRNAFSLPEVVDLDTILHQITYEIHRFTGFLRFKETANGTFYAPYSPDNDITDLLMPHFAARFRAPFIIHDVKRKIAGLFNGNEWIMTYVGDAEICLSESERAFESLWKKYYKSVNIKERPHEKQMKGYMPVRYWKFLPEKNG